MPIFTEINLKGRLGCVRSPRSRLRMRARCIEIVEPALEPSEGHEASGNCSEDPQLTLFINPRRSDSPRLLSIYSALPASRFSAFINIYQKRLALPGREGPDEPRRAPVAVVWHSLGFNEPHWFFTGADARECARNRPEGPRAGNRLYIHLPDAGLPLTSSGLVSSSFFFLLFIFFLTIRFFFPTRRFREIFAANGSHIQLPGTVSSLLSLPSALVSFSRYDVFFIKKCIKMDHSLTHTVYSIWYKLNSRVIKMLLCIIKMYVVIEIFVNYVVKRLKKWNMRFHVHIK